MIRSFVESVLRVWPLNRILFATWRHVPFPPGARSRIIRRANDTFLVGVMVLITEPDGRVMLVQNSYDPQYRWSLPGGWMGRNEQPEECIRREVREETGYEISVTGLISARTNSRIPSVDLIYGAAVEGGVFRRSAEVSAAEFFPAAQLPPELVPGHARIIGDALRSRIESLT